MLEHIVHIFNLFKITIEAFIRIPLNGTLPSQIKVTFGVFFDDIEYFFLSQTLQAAISQQVNSPSSVTTHLFEYHFLDL